MIVSENTKPTEEEIILNSKLEHLYNHEFEEGRYFQVVFSDDNETDIKFASKTMLKIVYIKQKDDIEGIEIIKVVSGKQKESLRLSKFNIEQLRCFLDFINSIDLKGISERRISLADEALTVLDTETKKRITTLLSGDSGSEVVSELLRKGLITNQDLVNTGYRKQQLKIFEALLYQNKLDDYKKWLKKPQMKDETAWQYFFKSNEWMFGYGLDYRFQGILQREFHASDSSASGKDTVVSDYLIGDKRFTTFIELKLPTTKIFGTTQNRSKSWRLSNDLIDAYSQILEQKASGQIKIETTKELLDEFNNEISQHAYDFRTILIIGSWGEIESDNLGTKSIKEKTFELFRRDSRNVDIITYDELFERANFIVKNEVKEKGKIAIQNKNKSCHA